VKSSFIACQEAVTTAYSSCGHLWMAWLECHLCPSEEPEAVVLDTTESCCRQLKPSLHSCTTCWSNWGKCPAHKCAWFLTSHAGFLTHFLNSHNPSPADQFLIRSNGLQTGQEFKLDCNMYTSNLRLHANLEILQGSPQWQDCIHVQCTRLFLSYWMELEL